MSELPPTASLKEFTVKAVLAGLAFGVVFGAANAYLGLKAGLTVSTSIPIAVLSVAVFKLFRGGTILEANLSQTVGSASSSLASGTIFTIPALFMWSEAPHFIQVATLACFGGLLGILAMVPLRRLLIVKADAELPYPEGQACAEVLKATEKSAVGSGWIFAGIALGGLTKLAITGLHLLPGEVSTSVPGFPNGTLSLAVAPALVAVGYIVGFKAASVMVAGGLLSALFIYPIITEIHARGVIAAKGEVAMLTPKYIKDNFAIYIGAGAVAAAGLVTIIKTAPTMVRSFVAVVEGVRRKDVTAGTERTDRDMPPYVLVLGLLAVALVLAFVPGIFAGNLSQGGRLAAALGVVVFGLIFVPVSSRLVGLIGVSSNPTSAMALITLAGTALAFILFGLGGAGAKAAVLTVGTVVCVAASKAGDISQDLKTGWLVKGTPALQQFGQLIAACVACFAVAGVLMAIGYGPEGFVGDGAMPAPQARLMKTVVEAVLGDNLPWDFVLMGASVSAVGALAGLPALPLALGIYLPLSTMAAVFVGGLVRKIADGKSTPGAKKHADAGILCASGFVAGEGLAGVLIAGYALATSQARYTEPARSLFEDLAALLVVVAVSYVLLRAARSSTQRES